ncbi:MAG: hypothetical protein ABIR70_09860 [Bryobacteraceae bacterium]
MSGGGSVLKGIGLGIMAFGLGLTVIGFLLGFAPSTAEWLFIPLFYIGAAQLVWIVPMVLRFRSRGETETVKGIVIIAAVVAILNASCWGLLSNFRIAG